MNPGNGRVIVCADCKVSALMLPKDAVPGAYYWTETRCPPCLAKVGRVMSAPRVTRVHASVTGTTVGSTGKSDSSISTDTLNGHYVNGILPGLEIIDTVTMTDDVVGNRGVWGGRGAGDDNDTMSRRRDIPEALQEFDAILRMHHTDAPTKHHPRVYKPTASFYDRILVKLAAIPGDYNITDAARDMIDWLAVHRDRTKDIARFAEKWLEIEGNRRQKWGRNGKQPPPKTDAQRYRMGGGLADTEGHAVDSMAERGGSHYEQ